MCPFIFCVFYADVSIIGMTEIPANSSKLTNITLAIAMASGVCEQVMVAVPSKSTASAATPQALQLPTFYYHTACVNATTVLRLLINTIIYVYIHTYILTDIYMVVLITCTFTHALNIRILL